jgi:hypothetical protein
MPPGEGDLPLRELLSVLLDEAALYVEVPMTEGVSLGLHEPRVFVAAKRLFEALREDGGGPCASPREMAI